MAALRDTEDGINEAGWEVEMSAVETGRCERCKDDDVELYEHWLPQTFSSPSEPEYLCRSCYERKTQTGAYDPDNRDWDAVRDEQDGY